MNNRFHLLLPVLLLAGVMATPTAARQVNCSDPYIFVGDQATIDTWNCTSVQDLEIFGWYGTEIENLHGLSILTSANSVKVANTRLTDLDGLQGLTEIPGNLTVTENEFLTSLHGLENLQSVGGQFFFVLNNALTDLAGLDNLHTVGGEFFLLAHASLRSLHGLESLTTIGDGPAWQSFIQDNPVLENIDALAGVTYFRTQILRIERNPALQNCSCGLQGLKGGDPVSFVGIVPVGDPAGQEIVMADNAPGGICNSAQQVLDNACAPPPPQGTYDIYAVDVRTGETTRLTFLDDTDEYNAAMSPNGKTVVHEAYGSLYLTDVKTGASTPLAGGEWGNDARFSPNGKYIAFDRDNNVYVVPAEGGTATLVRAGARSADWSNDSKRLVFQDIAYPESIRTIRVDGTDETLVAPYGEHPAWSGDGKTIAFGMYTPGDQPGGPNTAIYTVKVNHKGEAKGAPVAVTTPDWNTYDVHASFSNNGKTIAFMRIGEFNGWDADIYTVPAKGGDVTRLTGTVGRGDYDPAFSNNGRFVVFSAYTEPGTAGKGHVALSELFAAPEQPEGFALEQNYPNPFNPSTSIHFAVPEAGQVRLSVFDVTGREVAVLVDRPMEAGSHSITWSAAAGLPSGTYLYRLTAGGVSQTRLLTLVK